MKLNLGCGNKKLDGWVNCDFVKDCDPDRLMNLESLPWEFPDNSVTEVLLSHVLEHVGQDHDTYIGIIKELYRICCNKALIHIRVPHPRHDDFLTDPTHVRPITISGLSMFDRELNEAWQTEGAANTPLAIYHAVNFKVEEANSVLDDEIARWMQVEGVSKAYIAELARHQNNVIKELQIKLRVIKE